MTMENVQKVDELRQELLNEEIFPTQKVGKKFIIIATTSVTQSLNNRSLCMCNQIDLLKSLSTDSFQHIFSHQQH